MTWQDKHVLRGPGEIPCVEKALLKEIIPISLKRR